MNGDLLGRWLIALRGTAGARTAFTAGLFITDLEITIAGKPVEVMAGDVWVDSKQLSNVGCCQRVFGLTDGDIDCPACRVAQ